MHHSAMMRRVMCVIMVIILNVIIGVNGACPHQLPNIIRWSQWQDAPTSP